MDETITVEIGWRLAVVIVVVTFLIYVAVVTRKGDRK